MTTACIHYLVTGKTTLFDAAKKATDFLYNYYKSSSPELARSAICPSHYMGVVEMYRTTKDTKYPSALINQKIGKASNFATRGPTRGTRAMMLISPTNAWVIIPKTTTIAPIRVLSTS